MTILLDGMLWLWVACLAMGDADIFVAVSSASLRFFHAVLVLFLSLLTAHDDVRREAKQR